MVERESAGKAYRASARTSISYSSWPFAQPMLGAGGANDPTMITANSHLLAHHVPNARR